MPGVEEQLRKVEQRLGLVCARRCPSEGLPSVLRGSVVVTRTGSDDQQLVMRDCNRIACSTWQLDDRLATASRLGKGTTVPGKDSKTNPGSSAELRQLMIGAQSLHFLIVVDRSGARA